MAKRRSREPEPAQEEPEAEAPAPASRTRRAVARRRVAAPAPDESDGGIYDIEGADAHSHVYRFHSGSTLMDCVVGGGKGGAYPEGRIVNIAGKQSTNKTGAVIEACANFAVQYPDGWIRYNEAEAAFDQGYAKRIGLPLERVEFAADCFTVEDVFKDMEAALVKASHVGKPGLYILDSLDALSDDAEQERKIDDKSYDMTKAKKMSQMFRRLVKKMSNAKVTFIIVSQLRDKIGVSYGEKDTRAGGRSLDFYASCVLWMYHIGQIKRTVNGIERIVGVRIKVKCKKNKCGPPFREAEFPVIFEYGIDDVESMADWLVEIKSWDKFDTRKPGAYLKWLDKQPRSVYKQESRKLSQLVRTEWDRIEASFSPNFSKYGD